jgi:N-acetyl-anhydromuramyl-L-alanine amidase AmpD
MPHTHIIVHHTGAEEKDAGQVKRYHLSLGWRDIGYNYVIERSGRVVEGRPLNIPGAHCRARGMNRRAIGVAVIGNLEKHKMRAAQWEALVKLLQTLARRYGIPVQNILGHREVPGAATACPGRFTGMDSLRAALLKGEKNAFMKVPELWRVQVGAFAVRENAERYARRLQKRGINALVVKDR